MDEDSAGKSELSDSSAARPQDGRIDFSLYSIEQLRELQYSIDKNASPQNFMNLLAALKRKEEGTAQSVAQSNCSRGG